jgi:hypothetical protein
MLLSRYQKAAQKHGVKIVNRSFEVQIFGNNINRSNTGRYYEQTIQGMLPTIRFSPLTSRLLSRKVKVNIYKTIILPVVLYGCEICSLTLREDHTLRVFENRVLRRIFGPKRDEVTEWRKLHNEELHILYSSTNIIRQIK